MQYAEAECHAEGGLIPHNIVKLYSGFPVLIFFVSTRLLFIIKACLSHEFRSFVHINEGYLLEF